MNIHSITNSVCLMISLSSLGAGYILDGNWQILPAIFVMLIIWLITRNRSTNWSASRLLFIYVILAAIGVAVNLSLPLMVIGCTTALASWEMSHFNQNMVGNSLIETKVPMEKYHLRSLFMMIGATLLLELICSYIYLKIPFGVIVLLILIAIGSLKYCMQYLTKFQSF